MICQPELAESEYTIQHPWKMWQGIEVKWQRIKVHTHAHTHMQNYSVKWCKHISQIFCTVHAV